MNAGGFERRTVNRTWAHVILHLTDKGDYQLLVMMTGQEDMTAIVYFVPDCCLNWLMKKCYLHQ